MPTADATSETVLATEDLKKLQKHFGSVIKTGTSIFTSGRRAISTAISAMQDVSAIVTYLQRLPTTDLETSLIEGKTGESILPRTTTIELLKLIIQDKKKDRKHIRYVGNLEKLVEKIKSRLQAELQAVDQLINSTALSMAQKIFAAQEIAEPLLEEPTDPDAKIYQEQQTKLLSTAVVTATYLFKNKITTIIQEIMADKTVSTELIIATAAEEQANLLRIIMPELIANAKRDIKQIKDSYERSVKTGARLSTEISIIEQKIKEIQNQGEIDIDSSTIQGAIFTLASSAYLEARKQTLEAIQPAIEVIETLLPGSEKVITESETPAEAAEKLQELAKDKVTELTTEQIELYRRQVEMITTTAMEKKAAVLVEIEQLKTLDSIDDLHAQHDDAQHKAADASTDPIDRLYWQMKATVLGEISSVVEPLVKYAQDNCGELVYLYKNNPENFQQALTDLLIEKSIDYSASIIKPIILGLVKEIAREIFEEVCPLMLSAAHTLEALNRDRTAASDALKDADTISKTIRLTVRVKCLEVSFEKTEVRLADEARAQAERIEQEAKQRIEDERRRAQDEVGRTQKSLKDAREKAKQEIEKNKELSSDVIKFARKDPEVGRAARKKASARVKKMF